MIDLHFNANGQKTRPFISAFFFSFVRLFWLIKDVENWSMMTKIKMIPPLHWCWQCGSLRCAPIIGSLQCGSDSYLGRCAIHRNHGVAACAGTHKQHQSGRWLPPRGWTVRRWI
jgi:hypothetical protein